MVSMQMRILISHHWTNINPNPKLHKDRKKRSSKLKINWRIKLMGNTMIDQIIDLKINWRRDSTIDLMMISMMNSMINKTNDWTVHWTANTTANWTANGTANTTAKQTPPQTAV